MFYRNYPPPSPQIVIGVIPKMECQWLLVFSDLPSIGLKHLFPPLSPSSVHPYSKFQKLAFHYGLHGTSQEYRIEKAIIINIPLSTRKMGTFREREKPKDMDDQERERMHPSPYMDISAVNDIFCSDSPQISNGRSFQLFWTPNPLFLIMFETDGEPHEQDLLHN